MGEVQRVNVTKDEPQTDATAPLATRVGQGGSRTWRRFRRHKLALLGSSILLVLVLTSAVAPWISGLDPLKTNVLQIRQAPSAVYWLGTDGAGRDVLARLIYGGRISLSVGLVSVSIAAAIGIFLGSLAGFYRGLVDDTIMRFTEAVMVFPSLILIITVVSLLGPSFYNVMVVLGLLGWTGICRLVRGQIFSLRERDFVIAAQMLGVRNRRIIFRHILPNVMSPVIVAMTFGVAGAILTETGLSFLGLGVPPPAPSWGNMLNAAKGLPQLEGMPWLWLPPGLMITMSVMCINFVGDALRDALDPRTRD